MPRKCSYFGKRQHLWLDNVSDMVSSPSGLVRNLIHRYTYGMRARPGPTNAQTKHPDADLQHNSTDCKLDSSPSP